MIDIRLTGATFEQMLISAAEALVATVIETDAIDPTGRYPISVAAESPEDLLVNWLSEVLYLLDGERIAIARFEIQSCGPTTIRAVAYGEPRSARHVAKLIVKGVTYHQLQVRQTTEGWHCQVFLDI